MDRHHQAKAGALARARFDADLAAQPHHRPLDDVEAHTPTGQPVRRLPHGEAGLEDGRQQLAVGRRSAASDDGAGAGQRLPHLLAIDAPAVVGELDEHQLAFLAGADLQVGAGGLACRLALGRVLHPVGEGVAQQVQQGVGHLLDQRLVQLDVAAGQANVRRPPGRPLQLAQGMRQPGEGPVEGDQPRPPQLLVQLGGRPAQRLRLARQRPGGAIQVGADAAELDLRLGQAIQQRAERVAVRRAGAGVMAQGGSQSTSAGLEIAQHALQLAQAPLDPRSQDHQIAHAVRQRVQPNRVHPQAAIAARAPLDAAPAVAQAPAIAAVAAGIAAG